MTLNLTTDNAFPALLAEREALKAQADAIAARLKAIDGDIAEKMGAAEEAVTNGWSVTRKLTVRKEYTVKESIFYTLRAKRVAA